MQEDAHSNAYKTIAYMSWPPPPLRAELVAIAGPDERAEPFDNSGPNSLHAEPTIAADELCDAIVCSAAGGRRKLVPNC